MEPPLTLIFPDRRPVLVRSTVALPQKLHSLRKGRYLQWSYPPFEEHAELPVQGDSMITGSSPTDASARIRARALNQSLLRILIANQNSADPSTIPLLFPAVWI